jgi:hypothetical protein
MAQIKKLSTELQPLDKLLDSSGDAGTSGQILSSTGSGTNWIAAGGSGTVTGNGTTNYIPVWSSSTALGNSIMYQTGSNVGIGTASPTTKLEINADDNGTTDLNLLNLKRTWSSGTSTDRSHGIKFSDYNSTNALIYADRTNSASNYNSDLIFYTNTGASGTNVEAKMIIKNDGKVGIGTSTPGTNLDIRGVAAQSLRVQSDSSATIIIDSDDDDSGTAGSYLHYRDNGATKWSLYKETNNDFYLHNAAASKYPIHAKAGGDIILMEDGNKLGVGASTPSRTLHVGGAGGSSGGIMIAPTSGDAEIQFQDSGVTNAYITLDDGTGDMNFRDDSATVLTVDFSNERVGVLNASPQYALDVAGVIKGTSSIRVDAGSPYFGLYNSGTEKAYLQWSQTGSVLTLQSDGAINYTSGGLQKWTISGTQLLTLTTGGDLQIGTTTVITSGRRFYSADGTNSAPAYSFSGRTDTGMYARDHSSNDRLAFSVDGTERAYIDSNGITSMGNYYLPSGNSFRNYSGVWTATTGTTGNGFQFYNTADNSSAVLLSITSVASAATDSVATFSGKVVSAQTASSDGNSVLTTKSYVDGLVTGVTRYMGLWDASSGTGGNPDLTASTYKVPGYYFIVSVAGDAEPNGAGTEPDTWHVGDWVIWSDQATDAWQKIDNTSVLSGTGTANKVAMWNGDESLTNAPITISSNDSTFAGTVAAEDNIHLTDAGTVRAKLLLNASDRDNVELRAESLGSTMKFFTVGTEALELDASQNATFAGQLTVNGTEITVGTNGSIFAENNIRFKSSGPAYIDHNTTSQSIKFRLSNSSSLDVTPLEITPTYISLEADLYIPSYIRHSGDSNTLIGFNASDQFIVQTGGTHRLTINNTNATFAGSITATTETLTGSTSILLTLNPTANNYGGIQFNYNGAVKGLSVYNSGSMVYGGESGVGTILQVDGQHALNIDTSKNATFAGSVHLNSDSAQLQLGDDNDMQIYHNGANGEINNATGNFTIDSVGDITLDAGGADIILRDDGTEFGRLKNDSSDFVIRSTTNNKDLKLQGVDNGLTITALRLDMSDAGWAHFNTGIAVGNSSATSTFAGNVTISGDLTVGSSGTGRDVVFHGDLAGEYFHWDENVSTVNIYHRDELPGLEVYVNGAEQTTQPQLKVGRSNTQYWGVYTEDRNAHLVHRQDETTGIMTTRFDQWDSNTGDNTGNWLWRSGDGTGASMTNAAILYQDGDMVLYGDLLTDSDSTADLGKTGQRWANIWVDNINGGTPTTGGPYLPLAGGTMTGNLRINDNLNLYIGNQTDLVLAHNGTTSYVSNYTGDLIIENADDDNDIIFKCDDGSGGVTNYIQIDGSELRTTFNKTIRLNDVAILQIGNNADLEIYHDGSDNFYNGTTGDMYFINKADDKDIIFQTDNGSGGYTTYFYLDGSLADGTNVYTRFPDNSNLGLGNNNDLKLLHDSNHSYIKNYTGDLYIENFADDGDVIFKSDDGSGGLTNYLKLWGAIESLAVYKDMLMVNDGNGGKLKFGASQDLQIYHDGSNSYIDEVGTGSLYIRSAGAIRLQSDTGENMIYAVNDGAVNLYHNNSNKLQTTSTGINVTGDIADRDIPCLFNSNFLDGTASNIYVVPFNNNTETTISSRTYYHYITIPYAGKLTRVTFKSVSGTPSTSSFDVQLFLYVNGSLQASSSEISWSSANGITWSPTSSNTFSAGDEIFIAYQKSASSRTMAGVAVGLAIELTDYDI